MLCLLNFGEDAALSITRCWQCHCLLSFHEVYILKWRDHLGFIEAGPLFFHKKNCFQRDKTYVLVLNHLISFQFILQFTITYIFAVSGALGRWLEMTVKIMWSCYLGYLPKNTFYKSKKTNIFHEKHTLRYSLFWTSKNLNLQSLDSRN